MYFILTLDGVRIRYIGNQNLLRFHERPERLWKLFCFPGPPLQTYWFSVDVTVRRQRVLWRGEKQEAETRRQYLIKEVINAVPLKRRQQPANKHIEATLHTFDKTCPQHSFISYVETENRYDVRNLHRNLKNKEHVICNYRGFVYRAELGGNS
jgi:hypothetical protein